MTYTPPYRPYAHQTEALALMEGKEAFALFMSMRCVDGDTEYLSPTGWKRIADYNGGSVAEFRLDGTAHFVEPVRYIKAPVDRFWHFKTQGGVDQVLSEDHRILLCSSKRRNNFGKVVGKVPDGFRSSPRPNTDYWCETSPRELIAFRRNNKDHIPTSFFLKTETHIDMSDDEIRLMVAVHADGTLRGHQACVRVKRERKKKRLRELISKVFGSVDERSDAEPGFSLFVFYPPRFTKSYGPEWWLASDDQRKIITEEVHLWDGIVKTHRSDARLYSSRYEGDVDFVQYCFASTGYRSSKGKDPARERDGKVRSAIFRLSIVGMGRTNNLALLPAPKPYIDHDGFMYSFEVPSTYLVLRRNGKVFVTGNTGKSKTLLDDFGRLELDGKLRGLMVIAPGGVYRTWETAFDQHASADLQDRAWLHVWESGAGARAKAARREFLTDTSGGPRILLMNIEALSVMHAARIMAAEFLRQAPAMLVIDESTAIKNCASKRTKFITRQLAPLAPVRRILSGLPSPQSPLDLYSQFEFLDWRILGFQSYYAFRARYAIIQRVRFGGREVPLVKGYRNLEDLQRRIAPVTFRKRLEDCYDLPPKVYMRRDVIMTQEQARIYAEMKKYATTQLASEAHVTATIVITQMLRLHQILCGHVTDEHGGRHEVPTNRITELMALLEETDSKAIIWCSYDHDVQAVALALGQKFGQDSVARFWGGNRPTRETEEQRFLHEPEYRFMVATAAAGGRGRTWSCADLVVYYSNTMDLEHRAQSEERPQGVGKTQSVAYVDLVTPGTVDEKILHVLRNKINLSTAVIGDAYREWLI